ncbi:Diacylglycerol O-acyltransferase 1 [Micractinium conductrix]|uniref:diacylglycerol O-acyltransferase n=1 Tax=Micractinium conductrix TaxID=554055 RepID=A0A2P6VAM5_9CHLO|nr:Diacylglycerol O-acyltransferase 1 [Micractinium conductrix]|eukprot:PSC71143.1 Diacylglycerol O-acyltransferase 1 [Micractinium conductrix]
MLRTRRQSAAAAEATGGGEVAALKQENERLRDLLAEQAGRGATKSSYLCKYRGHATASLWAPTWELRYVILKGTTLTYFKSERDVQFPPRGRVELAGASVELEGLKRRRHWTWHIVDPQGVSLIRLSTEVAGEYHSWIEALERAGCSVKHLDDNASQGSQQTGQAGASPSQSHMSDSDAATYRGGQEVDSHPSSFAADTPSQRQQGAAEPRSGAYHPHHHQHHQQQGGYTSDQSDIGRPPAPPLRRQRSGARRPTMPASAPIHVAPRASLLSSERIRISDQSGIITLVFIILAATNFRLILENMIKYGFRFNPLNFLREAVTPSGNLPLLLCWPLLLAFVLAALGIERLGVRLLAAEQRAVAAQRKREVGYTELKRIAARRASATEHLMLLLNLANTTAAMLLPCFIILHTRAELLPGFALTMATCILWLKLISYAHCNWDYRVTRRRGEVRAGERGSGAVPVGVEVELRYPENITLPHLAYFVAAPTLCYQISYPRSKVFRARWMVKKLLMLTGGLGLMLFFTEQYMQPTIDNSMRALQDMDWLRMLERMLKLSLPTLYWWLAMFYTLFDLWLNVLAEILRFGDREFYKEWWNATTVGEYWRLWNQPVHKWMLRHVYFPLLRAGTPKFYAGLAVFFISAVFHEILVGVPLHMLRLWAFWGLMAQVPLMIITEWLKARLRSDRAGNVVFWVSFCFVGQPLAMILYYHDHRQGYTHPFAGLPGGT